MKEFEKFPLVLDICNKKGKKIPNCCVLKTCFIVGYPIFTLFCGNRRIAYFSVSLNTFRLFPFWDCSGYSRDVVIEFINSYTPKEFHVKSISDIKKSIRRGKFKLEEINHA